MKEENAKHEFIISLVNHVTKNLKDEKQEKTCMQCFGGSTLGKWWCLGLGKVWQTQRTEIWPLWRAQETYGTEVEMILEIGKNHFLQKL